jgi:hypothetical protein
MTELKSTIDWLDDRGPTLPLSSLSISSYNSQALGCQPLRQTGQDTPGEHGPEGSTSRGGREAAERRQRGGREAAERRQRGGRSGPERR